MDNKTMLLLALMLMGKENTDMLTMVMLMFLMGGENNGV